MTAIGPGLKSLQIEINLAHGTAIRRLFEATGSTLTSLYIDIVEDTEAPDIYTFDLKAISGWCPHVRSLFIQVPHKFETAEGQRQALLLSYGSQLQLTGGRFSNKTREFWLRISASCPNAKVDCVFFATQACSCFVCTGARLYSIRVKCRLRVPAESCYNVEILSIQERVSSNRQMLIAACFFASPKPKVRHLAINRKRVGDHNGSDTFCAIAKNSGGLRSINIFLNERVGRIGLRKVAEANVQLEQVLFSWDSSLFSSTSMYHTLTTSLSRFPGVLCCRAFMLPLRAQPMQI